MGVDLGDLVPSRTLGVKELSGKVLYVDGNNILYQFLASIRGPDGRPLSDDQGRVTSHLTGLLYRTANLVEAGVLPVFVWDGEPPEDKLETRRERERRRQEAQEAAEKAREEGDLETARAKAKQSSKLTGPMIDQADALLDRLGVPTVQAPGEAEAQAARAVRDDEAFALVSQDYDALLFGTSRLVRNLTTTQKRKVPGKDEYVEVEPEILRLDDVLEELELPHEQLVGLATLIGTDFHPGIDGVGPKRALDAMREHGDLAGAARSFDEDPAPFEAVAEIFLDPRTDPVPDVEWGPVDEEDVVDLLVGEHSFSEDRVRSTVERYANLEDPSRQGSLSDFL
jgi:flap endonuclease-1